MLSLKGWADLLIVVAALLQQFGSVLVIPVDRSMCWCDEGLSLLMPNLCWGCWAEFLCWCKELVAAVSLLMKICWAVTSQAWMRPFSLCCAYISEHSLWAATLPKQPVTPPLYEGLGPWKFLCVWGFNHRFLMWCLCGPFSLVARNSIHLLARDLTYMVDLWTWLFLSIYSVIYITYVWLLSFRNLR